MSTHPLSPDLGETLGRAAQQLAAELIRDPEQRSDELGRIFLLCEDAARSQPAAFARACASGDAAAFLRPHVRQGLTSEQVSRPNGGWVGTYVGGDLREVEGDPEVPDATDGEALAFSQRALQRAIAHATSEGNATLLRNLGWYAQRLRHRSYVAISRESGAKPATVRTGVARARKFVLKVVHELRGAQPAPVSGDAPARIEPLRRLWHDQALDQLERELEGTRAEYGQDPHWLNLAALLAADREQHERAERLYQQALLVADAASVRGRVLNNLGNLLDDRGEPERADEHWQRAHQLVPQAPAPLLNLLSGASRRQDYAAAQHYLAELADLMNSGRLTPTERGYVCRRLAENPKLAWLRDTDAWRVGPARWLKGRRPPRVGASLRSALASIVLLLVGAAWSADAFAATPEPERVALAALSSEPLEARSGGGGDSMGKPPKRSEPGPEPLRDPLHAGESMGRDDERPPRDG